MREMTKETKDDEPDFLFPKDLLKCISVFAQEETRVLFFNISANEKHITVGKLIDEHSNNFINKYLPLLEDAVLVTVNRRFGDVYTIYDEVQISRFGRTFVLSLFKSLDPSHVNQTLSRVSPTPDDIELVKSMGKLGPLKARKMVYELAKMGKFIPYKWWSDVDGVY